MKKIINLLLLTLSSTIVLSQTQLEKDLKIINKSDTGHVNLSRTYVGVLNETAAAGKQVVKIPINSFISNGGVSGVYLPLAGGTMTGTINFGTGGQNISRGSFDNGTGGDNGISLNCAVGYELNWQGGWLSSSGIGSGGTYVPIRLHSPLAFTMGSYLSSNDDNMSVSPDTRQLIGTNGSSISLDWDNGFINIDSILKIQTVPILYKSDTESYAFGVDCYANDSSFTVGFLDTATFKSYAFGYKNNADTFSTAIGSYNISVDSSLAVGLNNTVDYFTTAVGIFNEADSFSTVVGLGNSIITGSNVVGLTNSDVTYSSVLGSGNTYIQNSVVIGDNHGNLSANSGAFGHNLSGELGQDSVYYFGTFNESVKNGVESAKFVFSWGNTTDIGGRNLLEFGRSGTAYFFNPISIKDGSEGVGKVLTSDANGIASWENNIITKKVTILNADVLSNMTGGIELISAPGINKYIQILAVNGYILNSTTPYDVENLFISQGGGYIFVDHNILGYSTANIYSFDNEYSNVIKKNEPVTINTAIAPANGDGNLIINVTYKITDY